MMHHFENAFFYFHKKCCILHCIHYKKGKISINHAQLHISWHEKLLNFNSKSQVHHVQLSLAFFPGNSFLTYLRVHRVFSWALYHIACIKIPITKRQKWFTYGMHNKSYLCHLWPIFHQHLKKTSFFTKGIIHSYVKNNNFTTRCRKHLLHLVCLWYHKIGRDKSSSVLYLFCVCQYVAYKKREKKDGRSTHVQLVLSLKETWAGKVNEQKYVNRTGQN